MRALAATLERAGWRWAPLIWTRIGRSRRARLAHRRAGSLARPAAMGRRRRAGQAGLAAGRRRTKRARGWRNWSAHAARCGPNRRPIPTRRPMPSARATRRARRAVALVEAGTGTGKTLGYLAPAVAVGGEERAGALDLHLHPQPAAPDRAGDRASLSRSGRARREGGRAQGARELSLPAELRRSGQAHRAGAGTAQRGAGADRALDRVATPTAIFPARAFPPSSARRCRCARSPTGAANASMPPARITASVSSSAPSAARAMRRIVVANHALVIAQAAQDWLATDETTDTPPERRLRYVFDEGHHLFDAADCGFAALLSGREMAELRRWIRGPEGRARTRMRGLEERLKDLIADDEEAQHALEEAVQAAGALAGEGWMARLHGRRAARAGRRCSWPQPISMCARAATTATLLYAGSRSRSRWAKRRCGAVRELSRGAEAHRRAAGRGWRSCCARRWTTRAPTLETLHRARGWKRRRAGWTAAPSSSCRPGSRMLETLETGEISDEFVDWFEIAREDGRDVDVGLERHWIDPTIPLAARGAGAGAWRADHLGHLARHRRRRRRRLAERRSAHRRAASAAAAATRASSARRSAMTSRRASSSSRMWTGAMPTRWRRPIANCSWPRAAARWACSPPCARCARSSSRIAAAAGRCRPHALRPACRPARHRRAGRSVPRRGECLPARHRCAARRRRRAGPLAAAGGVRQGALAQAHHPAQGAARALRQGL